MDKRGNGILLHVTSLPSPYGIGDLGPGAYGFADFLANTKQKFWQILPLNPTDVAYGNSPYSSTSAFAGNPLLISPEFLANDGLLIDEDIDSIPNFKNERVDYPSVVACKNKILATAYNHFKSKEDKSDYESFCNENSEWLEDFAVFVAIKENFNKDAWFEWPTNLRDREPEQLISVREQLHDIIEKVKFAQYLFFSQWLALKNYCNKRGIQIIGDIPIYVDYDSVDTWTHPELFNLDNEKRPLTVAGVPPDYFSETGQLWGNPVYRWDVLKDTGYAWWMKRIEHNLRFFDLVRIDHFRGLVAYWEVAANEETAINGRWVEAGGSEFFDALLKRFPSMPIIAEDLGVITDDVRKVIQDCGFPGMKILMFAFGDEVSTNPYVPHNYIENCLVYTGTHDNNTVKGWFKNEATPEDKDRLFNYIGHEITIDHIHIAFIKLAMTSIAKISILPMQDILGLGEEARMNIPSTTDNNWEWRLAHEQMTPEITKNLLEMTETYGRA
ncbi:MAG: 4-alpha-glucanotransferase [Candidatus Anammoxibacter sp.]